MVTVFDARSELSALQAPRVGEDVDVFMWKNKAFFQKMLTSIQTFTRLFGVGDGTTTGEVVLNMCSKSPVDSVDGYFGLRNSTDCYHKGVIPQARGFHVAKKPIFNPTGQWEEYGATYGTIYYGIPIYVWKALAATPLKVDKFSYYFMSALAVYMSNNNLALSGSVDPGIIVINNWYLPLVECSVYMFENGGTVGVEYLVFNPAFPSVLSAGLAKLMMDNCSNIDIDPNTGNAHIDMDEQITVLQQIFDPEEEGYDVP